MEKYNLIEVLEKRENFMEIIDYANRKGLVFLSCDEMERYYIDETGNYQEEPSAGKEWTHEGSSCYDIHAHYFPNMFSFKGIFTFIKAFFEWIKMSIKEPYLFKYPPIGVWTNWLFVLDSWEYIKHEMVEKTQSKEDRNLKLNKLTKNDVINYLDSQPYYLKLNDKFYYQKNDPTRIISLEDHDLRDGYSHKKAVNLINDWIADAYPIPKSIKFIHK